MFLCKSQAPIRVTPCLRFLSYRPGFADVFSRHTAAAHSTYRLRGFAGKTSDADHSHTSPMASEKTDAGASTHSEDPFDERDPQRNLKAHMISDSQADTRHFMEQLSFKRPVDSSVSSSVAETLTVATGLPSEALHTLPHPIWTPEAMQAVRITHCRPEKLVDALAYVAVKTMRCAFDVMSGYALGRIDERGWLNRIVFLETVAGVPGMVGGMVRHLNSLSRMERDYGWIHTLLEEAENERMHLMTALVLKKPSYMFRASVLCTQGFFLAAFFVSYLLSRRFAHRFVGYLEEEAVITYTKLIREIDYGNLPLFEKLPAPPVARDYWSLERDATFRDVVLAIRADESHHRDVNHTFAVMRTDSPNPFPPALDLFAIGAVTFREEKLVKGTGIQTYTLERPQPAKRKSYSRGMLEASRMAEPAPTCEAGSCQRKHFCPRIIPFLAESGTPNTTAASFAAYVVTAVAPLAHGDSVTFNNLLPYVIRLRDRMHCSSSCFTLGSVYVRRFLRQAFVPLGTSNSDAAKPKVVEQRSCVMHIPQLQQLSLVALVVAAKYLDDVFHTNSHYAKVGGLPIAEFNCLEQRFLSALHYELYVDECEFSTQLHVQHLALAACSPAMLPECMAHRRRLATEPINKVQQKSCHDDSRMRRAQLSPQPSQPAAVKSDKPPLSESHSWSSRIVQLVGVPVAAVMTAAERAADVPFAMKLRANV